MGHDIHFVDPQNLPDGRCPPWSPAIKATPRLIPAAGLAMTCERCGTPEVLTAAEAARYLGCSLKTLANLRADNRGPAYFKCGRVQYVRTDLDHWRNACRVIPTRR